MTRSNARSGFARAVLDATGTPFARTKPIFPDELGPMYWAGWALADYQWRTGFSFEEIRSFAPFNRIVDLYPTFHETDISRFLMRMEPWRHEAQPGTALKRRREALSAFCASARVIGRKASISRRGGLDSGGCAGIGTLIWTATIEFLLEQDLANLDVEAAVAKWPKTFAELAATFPEVYGNRPAHIRRAEGEAKPRGT